VTLKAARLDLATQIAAAIGAPTPTLAYDPPSLGDETVSVRTAGMTATEYRLAVTVYVAAVQSAQGQDRLDDLVDAIEGVAGLLQVTPRSDWTWLYDPAKQAFGMQTTIDYPRQDF